MDEMRDRLIEIIKEFEKQFFKEKVTEHHVTLENEHENRLADKLLAAGVIMLPLMQEVQTSNFNEESNTFDGSSTFWERVHVADGKVAIDVYMTEAEARAALEGKE